MIGAHLMALPTPHILTAFVHIIIVRTANGMPSLDRSIRVPATFAVLDLPFLVDILVGLFVLGQWQAIAARSVTIVQIVHVAAAFAFVILVVQRQ